MNFSISNFREKEPWMVKGARISKSGHKGTITALHISNVNGKEYIHSVNAQLDGVPHAFPYNAHDLDQLKN
jgi:hypothetical protein